MAEEQAVQNPQGGSTERFVQGGSDPQTVHERMRAFVEATTPAAKGLEKAARDPSGKFVKKESENGMQEEAAEAPEVTPEPEATEAPAEPQEGAAEAEVEQEEGTTPEPTPKTLRVKVDGEEFDVDVEEARLGYMRTAKFTKEMQALRAKEAELPQKIEAETGKIRGDYVNQLQLMHRLVMESVAPELLEANLEQLWATDPSKAGALQAKGQRVTATVQKIQNAMAAEAAKAQAKQQAEYAEAVKRAHDDLSTIADWGDDKYHGMLSFATSKYGFSQDEMGNVVDPRIVRMALDAQAYHDSVAKRAAEASKPRPAAPPAVPVKAVKPGTRVASPAVARYAEARGNLAKSGKLTDAAALFKAAFGSTSKRR